MQRGRWTRNRRAGQLLASRGNPGGPERGGWRESEGSPRAAENGDWTSECLPSVSGSFLVWGVLCRPLFHWVPNPTR